MDMRTMASIIDHTALKPTLTDAELETECEIAREYGVAAMIVKPCHVSLAARLLKGSGVKVGTVVGFPHGSATTASKVFETINAVENGASEIDMVINIGKLLSEELEYVADDIKEVAEEAHRRGAILKAIIETSCLTNEQKITACKLAQKAGADFVKTSTGYADGGATVEDIRLIRQTVGNTMGVKASGGIRTAGQAAAMVEAGATRIGTSATLRLLNE